MHIKCSNDGLSIIRTRRTRGRAPFATAPASRSPRFLQRPVRVAAHAKSALQKFPKQLQHLRGLFYRQVAQALGHLPDVGYVNVLKTADGVNRTYHIPANGHSASNSSWTNATNESYLAWEWEITFVTRAGDLPLMAAVWSDGRTSLAQDDGFEVAARSTQLTCASCQAFPSGSWSATAEAVVGSRMEVRYRQQTKVKCCRGSNETRMKQRKHLTYFSHGLPPPPPVVHSRSQ